MAQFFLFWALSRDNARLPFLLKKGTFIIYLNKAGWLVMVFMSSSLVRFKISFAAAIVSAVLTALLSACSSDDRASGNSAESGNPEFAGIVSFEDGTPAVAAHVRFIPADFNACEDTLADTLETLTDSAGRYAMRIPDGKTFAVEAYDVASGMRFISRGLLIDSVEGDALTDT